VASSAYLCVVRAECACEGRRGGYVSVAKRAIGIAQPSRMMRRRASVPVDAFGPYHAPHCTRWPPSPRPQQTKRGCTACPRRAPPLSRRKRRTAAHRGTMCALIHRGLCKQTIRLSFSQPQLVSRARAPNIGRVQAGERVHTLPTTEPEAATMPASTASGNGMLGLPRGSVLCRTGAEPLRRVNTSTHGLVMGGAGI
jgi:hypothetical protein